MPALIKDAGHRINEILVNCRPSQHGVAKYSFGNRALSATMDKFGFRWFLTRRPSYKVKGR